MTSYFAGFSYYNTCAVVDMKMIIDLINSNIEMNHHERIQWIALAQLCALPLLIVMIRTCIELDPIQTGSQCPLYGQSFALGCA